MAMRPIPSKPPEHNPKRTVLFVQMRGGPARIEKAYDEAHKLKKLPDAMIAKSKQILDAYDEALKGRDHVDIDVEVEEIFPHIFKTVPDVTLAEIMMTLRFDGERRARETMKDMGISELAIQEAIEDARLRHATA
jgi:hypothetical protein